MRPATMAVEFHLFVTVVLSLGQLQVQAEERAVAPSPCSAVTPPEETLSLNSILQSGTTSGDVYALLAGEHCVRNTTVVRDLQNISFRGPAKINCTPGNGIAFYNISGLSLSNLTIESCGLALEHIDTFLSLIKTDIDVFFHIGDNPDQYVALAVGQVSEFLMEDTEVSNTSGLGVLGVNVMGNSKLTNVTLQNNVPNGCFMISSNIRTNEKVGGGAMFLYHDYIHRPEPLMTTPCLEISKSRIMRNSYCGSASYFDFYHKQAEAPLISSSDLVIGGGGGLTFVLTQFQYQVNVTVSNSLFLNNTAQFGGGAHVKLFTGVFGCIVQFENCIFEKNGLEDSVARTGESPTTGSGLIVIKDYIQPNFNIERLHGEYIPTKFEVLDSFFSRNTAFFGVLTIFSLYSVVLREREQALMNFDNCTFVENRAFVSAAIFIQEFKVLPQQEGMSVILRDLNCSYNSLYNTFITSQSALLDTAVVVLTSVNLTITGNSGFYHNEGTALTTISSAVYVKDTLMFLNNSGTYGGGIHLSQSSYIVLLEDSTTAFVNNTAVSAGGGIYADFYAPFAFATNLDCIMYFGYINFLCDVLAAGCNDITDIGVKVIFEGNQAPIGSMLYGFTLNTCRWAGEFRKRYAPGMDDVSLLELLYQNPANVTVPFKFDSNPAQVLTASTPPSRITASATSITQDSLNLSAITLAPGLRKELNVTVLDAFGRQVSSVITSMSSQTSFRSSVGDTNFKFLGPTENVLDLLVYGTPNSTDIGIVFLAVSTFATTKFTVDIVDCPDGYLLDKETGNCTCFEYLTNRFISCTDNGTLLVPGGNWVGRESNGIFSHSACPLDYCQPVISIVDATDPTSYDSQCNRGYNRSGVACGSCAQGHSVVFGSNRCRECSNSFLLLIFLFAAYGVFLMAAIVLLQITISEGFLNGVLFFSNILTASAPHFAPSLELNLYFIVFFWLSLRLGFETCFFDGMTALSSTALHFVFPFYLYFLLLLIVLLARWSSRFARLVSHRGFSPTKLLATVMLMTYSSLLESCIEVLSLRHVTELDSEGRATIIARWRYDPSQRYFQGAHAPLAVFAILLLVFFLIPLPFVWMFHWKLSRFKPLYDAIWAPLKPRFRFWVSLRLILRLFPLVFVNFSSPPLSLIFLSFFLISLLYIHGVLQPFAAETRNTIDGFFQMLLLTIAVMSLYYSLLDIQQNSMSCSFETVNVTNAIIRRLDYSQNVTLIILVVISYAMLAVLIVWHLVLRFPSLHKFFLSAWNRCVHSKRYKPKQRDVPQIHMTDVGDSDDDDDDNDDHTKHSLPTSTASGRSSAATGHSTAGRSSAAPQKCVATYSELREPLLESGVLEIRQVKPSSSA